MNARRLVKKIYLDFIFLPELFFFTGTIAQTSTVKGKIEDALTGESLIGATVLIQGTTKGTVTDTDGYFALNDVQQGSYNFVISYITYEQQIHRANLQKGETVELNVKLKPISVELGEVKVIASRRSDTETVLDLIDPIKCPGLQRDIETTDLPFAGPRCIGGDFPCSGSDRQGRKIYQRTGTG